MKGGAHADLAFRRQSLQVQILRVPRSSMFVSGFPVRAAHVLLNVSLVRLADCRIWTSQDERDPVELVGLEGTQQH